MHKVAQRWARLVLGWLTMALVGRVYHVFKTTRSDQPLIFPGSLNWVLAFIGCSKVAGSHFCPAEVGLDCWSAGMAGRPWRPPIPVLTGPDVISSTETKQRAAAGSRLISLLTYSAGACVVAGRSRCSWWAVNRCWPRSSTPSPSTSVISAASRRCPPSAHLCRCVVV